MPSSYFASRKESRHDFLVREVRELSPRLASHLPDVELVEEVHAASNYSYHIKEFTGKGYLCVGDSHRFIDPIFSFGVHVSFAEARMVSEAIARYLNGDGRDAVNPFAAYQRRSELGQGVVQSLIDAFWNRPLAFGFFVHVRYVEDCIDMFAGRIYEEEPSPGLVAMRKLLEKAPEDMSAFQSSLGKSLLCLQEGLKLLYLGATSFGIRYSDLEQAKAFAYDTRSWNVFFAKLAERYEKLAEEALDARQTQSAIAWLEDSVNYYYFSQVFLTGDQKAAYQACSRRAYAQLAPLLNPPCRRVMMPFMDTHLPGYLRVGKSGAPCVLLVGPGSDPTSKEVVLHRLAEVFLKRGMSVAYFDGPGTGRTDRYPADERR